MTPVELIEGFVRESKLYELSDAPRANKALKALIVFGDEIVRRGGTSSLVQLMDNADPFIAYSAAGQLVSIPEFREPALAVLDRIADVRLGSASTRSRIARNVIRYGNPNGDPVAYEERLAQIRARESDRQNRLAERQAIRDGSLLVFDQRLATHRKEPRSAATATYRPISSELPLSPYGLL